MNWHDYFTYEDGNLIWKARPREEFDCDNRFYAWHRKYYDKVAGKIYNKKKPYIQISLHKKSFFAHRIIWEMHHGKVPEGMNMDHIDGCWNNNRIENLRIATLSQNSHNRKVYSLSTTGINGISKIKGVDKYDVQLSVNGKKVFRCEFDDFFEACCARKSAELKYGLFEYIRGNVNSNA